jgi:predicted nucleic acid-binding protein
MCLIVDANAAAQFLGKAGPVRSWLLGQRGEPRLVAAGALRSELVKLEDVRHLLVRLEQAGRLRSADKDAVDREEHHLRRGARCRSNDHHVLALAIVSGARTLATFDNALAADFRDAGLIGRPRGSIYRDPDKHSHLLRHTPVSCGVRASGKRQTRNQ